MAKGRFGPALGMVGNLNWTPGYTTRVSEEQTALQGRKLIIDAYGLWVFSPTSGGCDVPAMIGYCDIAAGTNKEFYQHYRSVGGHNGHFDFPATGGNDWGAWSGQLAAMSGDLVATIK